MLKKLKKSDRLNLSIILLFLLIPIILYFDVFINSKYLAPGDGYIHTLPLRTLYRQIIENKEFPLWNKYLASGSSYIGDIQNASFYIFNFLFVLLPSVFSFNYFFLFHLSLAGIFTYLYLNIILEKKYLSFLGGLIFLLSPVLNVRKGHLTVYSAVVWFPLILYFIEKFIRTNKKKYLIFLALIMSLQFLAGFPQVTVYSDIFAGFYFIIMLRSRKVGTKEIIRNGFFVLLFYIGFIGIQLLPLIEITRETGRVNINFDYFKSYSTPIKAIVMLFFPGIYGNQNGGNILNGYSQTEMAFYIGVIPIIGTIYTFFIKEKKNIYFSIFKTTFILTILYSMLGEISIIAKIAYKIPILNSFRVPSRINFIFMFSSIVLFCLFLNYIFSSEKFGEKIKNFLLFNRYLFILLAVAAFVFSISSEIMSTDEGIKKLYEMDSRTYRITFLLLILNMLIFKLYQKRIIKKSFLITIILFVTTIDLYRISIPYGKVFASHNNNYILNDLNIGNSRATNLISEWSDFDHDKSGVIPNVNILNNIPVIGAYATFVNKDYESLIGYYDLRILTSQRLIVENGILSMLSVKYIVENKNSDTIMDKNYDFKNLNTIYQQDRLVLGSEELKNEELTVIEVPISFEKNKLYKIEFSAKSSDSKEQLIIDLYGGEIYDFPEQKLFFNIGKISKKYSNYIYTGNKFPDSQVVLRYIKFGKNPLEILNFRVYEVGIKEEKLYELVKETEDYKVYENKEVKSILYKPENVIKQRVTFDSLDYDFSKNAYVEDSEKMYLENVETKISNINFKNSSINAITESSGDSFIVFSQSFYPGWRAYIDGKNTKIYKVNGVLQGIKVPGGKHKIEIKYFPNSLIYGAIMSISTLIAGIYLCLKKEKKNK